jgi:hypothetical protein
MNEKTPACSPCEHFWETHVPRILGERRDTTLRSLTCVVRFCIAGEGGGTWTVRVEEGTVAGVERDSRAPATSTIRLPARVFLEIAEGRADHRLAFFRGEIELGGNIPLLLWLANYIPHLRARFPYRVPRTQEASSCAD